MMKILSYRLKLPQKEHIQISEDLSRERLIKDLV